MFRESVLILEFVCVCVCVCVCAWLLAINGCVYEKKEIRTWKKFKPKTSSDVFIKIWNFIWERFSGKWLFLLLWRQQHLSDLYLRRFRTHSSPNCHVFQKVTANGGILFFGGGDQEVKIIISTYNLFWAAFLFQTGVGRYRVLDSGFPIVFPSNSR